MFLLVTGLRNNIDQLVSNAAMTFLSRSPKIELGPLDLISISYNYQEYLSVDRKLSVELSKLTKGYAFAYQVLGYLLYDKKEKSINDVLLIQFDKYLSENGYNTFWKELTNNEKRFCVALANSKEGQADEVQQLSEMNQSNFSNYRARLLRKEIITSSSYGKMEFTLPRFKEFILMAEQFGY